MSTTARKAVRAADGKAKASAKASATKRAPARKASTGSSGKASTASARATGGRRGRIPTPVHPGPQWLALMNEAGLSQTATAARMGVAAMTLNRLVNGHGIPTAKVTVAFAKAVGADVEVVWGAVCRYELALARQAAARK